MVQAIIMDFDGVIIDTEVVWYDIFSEWFLEKYEYNLSINEFLMCVGSNSNVLFKEIGKKVNDEINIEQFNIDTRERFIEKSMSLPAKEGIEDFIKLVKELGLKLALATSSERVKPTTHLKRLGLFKYFDLIITAEDVKRVKPFPDLFLKVLSEFQIESTEALIIEDSLNGLSAGIEAKIDVIVIPNDVTRYSDFIGCYKIYNSASELKKVELIDLLSRK